MTEQEQNELIAFFTLVVPGINKEFNLFDLVRSLIQRPSPFEQIADTLSRVRVSGRVRTEEEIANIFTTPGTAACVNEFIALEYTRRGRE